MKAVCTVSKMIAEEQYDLLKPLVNENTAELIKERMPLLSVEQKKLITVNEPDIQGVAPYLFQKANDEPTGRVFVKIGILYFVVPGFSDTLKKVFEPRNTVDEFQTAASTFKHNLIVADYRFVLSSFCFHTFL
jgi:hypothetical protein